MEADKEPTQGESGKRTVRKSPKRAKATAKPEADLKAAAEGTDQVVPGPAETPAKPTRGRAVRSVSTGAAAKGEKASGAPRETKRKATRRKSDLSPATEASSSPAVAEPAPGPTSSSSVEPAPASETTPAAVGETVILEQSPGAAGVPSEPLAVSEPPPMEEPTFEQIQLRAYFISERRRRDGLHGDDQSDWTQAREELLNELKGH